MLERVLYYRPGESKPGTAVLRPGMTLRVHRWSPKDQYVKVVIVEEVALLVRCAYFSLRASALTRVGLVDAAARTGQEHASPDLLPRG